MNRTVDSFGEQFAALSGQKPFRWQRRLFERLMEGQVPAALDLPTGLGKTSVMAIWLIARARGARLPRRLVYAVDRRAVVDQATDEAEKLRAALEGNAEHFVRLDEATRAQAKQTAAEMKKRLDVSDGSKLPISTLRGAHVDNREWLDDPAAPAIIVGTVDMIGSRLLFEGYGVSRRMRPYHAGLLGVDSLVVVDEAHLVPPFEALLRRIACGTNEFGPRTDDDREIVPSFKLLSLSATGRAQSMSHRSTHDITFCLEGEDLSDPVVEKRLGAKKTLKVVKIGDAKDALADALAEQAWMALSESDRPLRCLVYCDSREVAEKTKKKLDGLAAPHRKASETKADTELFVGARRVKEREDAKNWLQRRGFLAGSRSPAKPALLVATSAGEVGVDLDADHMVCDLVPWERMVQRLGRVNRRGEGNATIVVVHSEEPKPKKPDQPTEQEKRQIIGFRSLAVFEELPNAGDGKDVSPGALRELKLRAEADEELRKKIAEATTPEPLRPALSRALVDAWSMTALETHTGRPEVAPWLRGWVEDDSQATVTWRSHLPVREGVVEWPRTSMEKKEVEDFFEAAPPHQSEKLETETYRVASWLQDRANALLKRKPDAPIQSTDDEDADPEAPTADDIDTDKSETELVAAQARRLRRHDIVAFALSPDGEYKARYTLGDLAQPRDSNAKKAFEAALSERTLVVDARFGGMKDGLLDAPGNDAFETADGCDSWSRTAGFRVRRAAGSLGDEQEEAWRFEDDFAVLRNEEGDALERLVVEHFRDTAQREDARSISNPQELAEHQSWAEHKAQRIAERVGLLGVAAQALVLAASLHDEGKKSERWQRAFRAPREKGESGAYKIFAKTRGPINQAILDGYRHEFGSLPYVEENAKFRGLSDDWRELVLHLVASHHGQARPSISTQGCEDAPPSALELRARDVALRFAQLQKRWGPWGLAWWEALLRAADQQASRDNDEGKAFAAPHTEES